MLFRILRCLALALISLYSMSSVLASDQLAPQARAEITEFRIESEKLIPLTQNRISVKRPSTSDATQVEVELIEIKAFVKMKSPVSDGSVWDRVEYWYGYELRSTSKDIHYRYVIWPRYPGCDFKIFSVDNQDFLVYVDHDAGHIWELPDECSMDRRIELEKRGVVKLPPDNFTPSPATLSRVPIGQLIPSVLIDLPGGPCIPVSFLDLMRDGDKVTAKVLHTGTGRAYAIIFEDERWHVADG